MASNKGRTPGIDDYQVRDVTFGNGSPLRWRGPLTISWFTDRVLSDMGEELRASELEELNKPFHPRKGDYISLESLANYVLYLASIRIKAVRTTDPEEERPHPKV